MRIIRVFPRRTKATPTDEMVRIGAGPGFFDDADEVHISVTFTWDLQFAERLACQWKSIAPVKIGGPATGMSGDAFTPGMYLKHGYTITSRGCPNQCWFCDAWRREGNEVREFPIQDGWNILDSNLLACSPKHIRAVFVMLSRQPRKPEFTGGLEAARLRPWHCEELRKLKPESLFFAYDTPDDLEPLIEARKMLRDAGFPERRHTLRCYVLCGYPKDMIREAMRRIRQTLDAGFTPMAMLYRGKDGKTDPEWRKFQRMFARPQLMYSKKICYAFRDDMNAFTERVNK